MRDDHSLALVWIEHEIVPANPVTNAVNSGLYVLEVFK